MVQNRAVSSAVDRMPSVCVFGAGAVGLYLAAALEKAGLGENSLSLVCRGATYEHIHNTGHFTIKDVPEETVTVAKNFKLLDSAAIGEGFEAPDIVLSCAKGHHLPQALATLKRLVGVNTLLVTIQNGLPFHHGHLTCHPALAGKPLPAVDPGGHLFSTFCSHQVVAGVVYVAAERTGMAEVTCRSTPQVTRFLFGKVPESSTCQAAALLGVVDSLTCRCHSEHRV